LCTLGLNVFLIAKIPKGFFPQQDTGVIQGGMQGPQDTSFYAMKGRAAIGDTSSRPTPAWQNVMGFTGGQGATNTGFEFIALKPLNSAR
jgi:multidrug efflux pump